MHLVLLPGMDGTGKLFRRFIDSLPSGITATAVSYPSQQPLDWDELRELVLGQIPEEPFALVAESFSGPIAYAIAAKPPPNLRALVLCASFVSNPRSPFLNLLRPLLAPVVFRQHLPAFVARRIMVDAEADDELVRELQTIGPKVSPRVWNFRAKLILNLRQPSLSAGRDLPILYLQASHDRLVPPRCAEEIQQLSPQTKVEVISSGHLILQNKPQAAAATICKFLNAIPKQTS